ncbi:hypothetical protein [Shewanella sp. MM_2022_3]|uniref:hypothetical protein n=1 Tax=Shewanella sp. MM_2022_3 TaxID=2923280 RepID=UPI001F4C1D55|nr:hypothetical protein [Shewanella sp. MM_2022_3]MCH7424984.1 hypothetical protein [Shewanella sp. MM_2022_3]
MITVNSQEAVFYIENIDIDIGVDSADINAPKHNIAFIGDYTACSLLAGRAVKTQKIDYDESIYSMFDLPHNKSNYVAYWVKENHLVFKDNTTHYVIVHNDYRKVLDIRRSIMLADNSEGLIPVLLNETESESNRLIEPKIQIVKYDDADGLLDEQRLLKETDWEVVKQLEILLLSDTDLGRYRAELRKVVNEKQVWSDTK